MRHVPAWWATPATGMSFFMYANRWKRWPGSIRSLPSIECSCS